MDLKPAPAFGQVSCTVCAWCLQYATVYVAGGYYWCCTFSSKNALPCWMRRYDQILTIIQSALGGWKDVIIPSFLISQLAGSGGYHLHATVQDKQCLSVACMSTIMWVHAAFVICRDDGRKMSKVSISCLQRGIVLHFHMCNPVQAAQSHLQQWYKFRYAWPLTRL